MRAFDPWSKKPWNLFNRPNRYLRGLLANYPNNLDHEARDDVLLRREVARVLRNERLWRNIRHMRILYYWIRYYGINPVLNPLKRGWRDMLIRLRIVDNEVQPVQSKEALINYFAEQAVKEKSNAPATGDV